MMGKTLLIYTEGGVRLGLGNVYRCLSLARAVRESRPDISVSFVSSSPENVISIITSNGFAALRTDSILPSIIEAEPDCLLIDFLDIPEDFVRSVKDRGIKVVIVGNSNEANRYADLVVNAIIGTGLRNREFTDSFGTRNLWGPEYLVLREEFERLRDTYGHTGNLHDIVLLFGGSDQSDFTRRVAAAITGRGYRISIIAGGAYGHFAELEAEAGKCGDITLYHNISNVSDIYRNADFLFTSPGTALFEGLCIGIPAVSFYQNQSQIDVFGNFFTCNRFTDGTDPERMMKEVYGNYEAFKAERDILNVGGGRSRIISTITDLIGN